MVSDEYTSKVEVYRISKDIFSFMERSGVVEELSDENKRSSPIDPKELNFSQVKRKCAY